MSIQIFIGYSSKDEYYAQFTFNCLRNIVEFLPYKAEIFPDYGKVFKERIMNALDLSEFMVVFLTDNGIQSQWVNQEIGYAHALQRKNRNNKPYIIPISQDQTKPKGLITKDSNDLLILDKFQDSTGAIDFSLVFANILLYIRNNLPDGLREGSLKVRLTCTNCIDKTGFPYEWTLLIPDNQTIYRSVELNQVVTEIPCPQCNASNYFDIRTFSHVSVTT